MKYRLLGIDLDGTLLRPDQTVSDDDQRALRDAHDAGVTVVPCTGRAWHESAAALSPLDMLDQGVFVTGALVTEMKSGTTRDHAAFEPQLAADLIDTLSELPEAVLVFRVPDRVGHDYLITGRGEVTRNSRWWFETTKARVYENRQLEAGDYEHCVRVAIVSSLPDMQHLVADVHERFDGKVEAHSFDGVERTDDMDPVQILEIFPAGVTKWRGLRAVADQLGIDDQQIAVIGDQINDLPAMQHAGCAVAMGNAVPSVKAAADHVTKRNTESGVAHAIRQMLDGSW